mmetsp:Transcript_3326/g.6760  ORF Transcript_3326/g.6760 Transcript_3326/m.6760 type:complete len:311 (-) Transcript_3326:2755-3687(-)
MGTLWKRPRNDCPLHVSIGPLHKTSGNFLSLGTSSGCLHTRCRRRTGSKRFHGTAAVGCRQYYYRSNTAATTTANATANNPTIVHYAVGVPVESGLGGRIGHTGQGSRSRMCRFVGQRQFVRIQSRCRGVDGTVQRVLFQSRHVPQIRLSHAHEWTHVSKGGRKPPRLSLLRQRPLHLSHRDVGQPLQPPKDSPGGTALHHGTNVGRFGSVRKINRDHLRRESLGPIAAKIPFAPGRNMPGTQKGRVGGSRSHGGSFRCSEEPTRTIPKPAAGASGEGDPIHQGCVTRPGIAPRGLSKNCRFQPKGVDKI